MRRSSIMFLAACAGIGLLAASPAHAQKDFASATRVANSVITPVSLRQYLTFIASDELEGRNTPSRGLDTAAQFIAFHLSKWGVKPMGGDGTYFQKLLLTRRQIEMEKCTASYGDTALKLVDDFAPFALSNGGTASGNLVYAGHGYFIKKGDINPYKGVDVKGKIVIITGQMPAGVNRRQMSQLGKIGEDWMPPAMYAEKNGAAGIAYVPAADSPETFKGFVAGMTRFSRGFQPANPDDEQGGLPMIYLSPGLLEKLFTGEKKTAEQVFQDRTARSGDGFELAADKKLTFTVVGGLEKTYTRNVVGVVEGSDPKLKSEYVALGAHYDHEGVRGPAGTDTIYNGADDDGSGTVALLNIAEALSKSPVKPRRSVIFVWHCGEEKGLWGSEYFVENPTVPLSSITAQINIDMIGRSKPAGDTNPRNRELSGPNGIYVIGATMMSTELENLTKVINDKFLKMEYDYRYDAPTDPNRFFYRSDHYNYAKKGIPILFFFDGEHVDYHRPSDEVDKIDFEKMAKVTRTVFVTLTEIANREKRLTVDKKLDR